MCKNLSLISSEAVGIGHPDKICDQISDRILVQCLKNDKDSRVACEVFASNHLIVIGGEISTKSYVDVTKCAWDVLLPLGYNENDFTILSNINKQSPEISDHVNKKNHLGSGDMGIVYGYATNETSEYLPLPYVLATRIIFEINQMTRNHQLKGLCFDTKCQVSIYYDENNFPVRIDNIILSIQHKKDADLDSLFNKIVMRILKPLAKKYKMNTDFKITFNNGGNFILGGPFADTGLTGRKLMVDTYGTIAHHGGGAFSGKDYTKIDRTGAYFARFIAKNMVANNFADRMEVQLVYNIGNYTPTSIYINCFGTEKCQIQKIYKIVNKTFDFELSNIVKKFDLEKFDFTKTSIYGHFTNLNSNSNYPWEKIFKIK